MRQFLALFAGVLLFITISGCASSGTHVGRAAEPVAQERAGLRSFALANGLTLIVKDSGHEGPVSVQVWVAGGSVADPAGRPGVAHMAEHILLSGSLHVPPGRAEYYVESMGGRLYAHTGRDFMYFGATLPGKGWERAEDILYDIIAYPSFRQEQFDAQKKAVALEIGQRAGEPDTLLLDNFFAEAFQSHPYKNPVTGEARDLGRITLQDVKDYYRKMFVPDNMVVVVTGGVTHAAARAAVDKTFGRTPRGAQSIPRAEAEPLQLYKRVKAVSMPVRLNYMALGWRVTSANDPDIYALDVLTQVIGGGKGSRLFLELQERKGLAFNVRAELVPLKDQGLLVIFADIVDGDNVRPVTDEILKQMNRLKDEAVSAQEVERAIQRIQSMHMVANETCEGQAYSLGYWSMVYGGNDPALYMQRIRNVTPREVQRAAQRYLGEGNYTISIIRPEGETGGV